MGRLQWRHWTAVLIVAVVAIWAVFYFPDTPSFAVLQMKMAIDARDGDRAARFVDFQSVVRKAGMQMVQKQAAAGDPLAQFIGRGAVQLLSAPAANLVEQWAKQKVDDGAREVQMPAAALAGGPRLSVPNSPP